MDHDTPSADSQRQPQPSARRWRFLPRRLNVQLIAVTAVLVIANLVGVTLYIVSEFIGFERHDAEAQIRAVAENLALGAAPLILTRDYGSLEGLLQSAADYPGLRSLALVDANHRVLSEIQRGPGGRPEAIYGTVEMHPPQGEESHITWIYESPQTSLAILKAMDAKSLVIWRPVEEGHLGWLRVEVSARDFEARTRRLILNSGAFILVFMALSSLLLYALLRPSLQALVRATRFAQGLAGDSGKQMKVSRVNVEVEMLGQTLNEASMRLHTQESALKAGQIQIAAVVENLADGVVTIDEHGAIQMVNSALCRLLGYAQEQLIGRNVSCLMPEPVGSAHDGYLQRYMRSGQARIIGIGREVLARHQDGRAIPVQLAVNQYKIDDAQYFVGTLHDLRSQKMLIGELQQARDTAIEASRAKSDFLAAMSHEIRTPLNGVIGMLDLLRQSSLDEQQAKMAEIIHESAHTLLNIINDILDLSKIEAGKLEVSPEPMSVEDLVEGVCMLQQPLAAKKGVELMLFVDPRIPRLTSGDALRIRQVLTNLVNNAIKFSSGLDRDARVELRTQLMMEDEDRLWIEFVVRDNGIGMSAATQNKLFQPFEQADAHTTKRYGGTGLGLAICHHLTTMMGGRISVVSSLGRGSAFTVILPLGHEEQPAEPASLVAGLSCVVIGADTNMAADIAMHLEHAGAEVTRVTDLDALRALSEPLPTLWIWVLEFTGVPDVTRMRSVAHQLHGEDLRILLVQHLSVNRGRRLKPRRLAQDMVQVDGNLLTRRRILEAAAIAAGRDVKPEASTIEGMRHSAVPVPTREVALKQGRLVLVAEDNEVNQLVIRSQLERIGLTADIVSNGQMALERWRTGQYGLVLSDLHMPLMDGYQLANAIREQEEQRGLVRTPIVALSAATQRGEAERCKTVGIDDYLAKPVSIDRLKETLEKWLPPSGLLMDDGVTSPAETVRHTADAHLDLGVLRALVGDDPGLIGQLLQEFRMRSSPIADAIVSSLVEGRLEELGFQAHKLKSSARSVGASILGELCQQLETAGRSGQRDQASGLVPEFEAELDAVLTSVDRYIASQADHDKEGNDA